MLSMSKNIVCKLLQRQTYDILSQKYSCLICCLCVVGLLISAFRFGEQIFVWNQENRHFSLYLDNLMGKSYENNLCQYLPIDVVYTWVNGTDPELLHNLAKVKLDYELQINISRFGHNIANNSHIICPFSHCIESHMILLRPPISNLITIHDLNSIPDLKTAKDVFPVHQLATKDEHLSASVIVFDTKETAKEITKKQHLIVFGANYTVHPAFLTSEWTAPYSVYLEDIVMVMGVHERLNEERLLKKFPQTVQHHITNIYLHPDKSLALLKVVDKSSQDAILQMEGNFTIDNKQIALNAANLLLYIGQGIVNDDISASRFQDNEELRYSLRSIEKFAPWVRNVFIVTNGQIPSWLNLENPRVKIITHEQIYPNKSHLPTFSSPSIETHLHRIPNLSKKFLYLNDDVVFGKEVWPEDFYTHSKGYKVYLSWSVPDCREGCPASWIDDGYCDRPCNNSDCQWDGGDCKEGMVGMLFNNDNSNIQLWREESEKLYCSVNCANSWLADRYCDQACNVFDCGFDAGDCGIEDFDKLFAVTLDENVHEYYLPSGIRFAYFSLSGFLASNRSITEGNYEENKAIRVVSVNQKFQILTLLLFPNYTETLQLSVTGFKNGIEYQFEFNVTVDTRSQNNVKINKTKKVLFPPKKSTTKSTKSVKLTTTEKSTTVKLEEFDENLRHPKRTRLSPENIETDFDKLNTSGINFPPEITLTLNKTEDLYKKGYLTDKGYKLKKFNVINEFLNELKKQNPSPTHKSRDIKSLPFSLIEDENPPGKFPWEKKKYLQDYSIPVDYKKKINFRRRRLLDTFGDSLRHVNRLLNREFGYETRKVPAHMAHLVDGDLIMELQSRFAEEFDVTSSHKIRSRDDMQFAFSFFYFVMSELEVFNITKLFFNYDTDYSETWSDREIRTLLTQIYELPLTAENVVHFDSIILNCSKTVTLVTPSIVIPQYERYLNSQLPIVSRSLIENCDPLIEFLKSKLKPKKKYKFEIIGEEEIAFKMIRNNISQVIAQLDDIRKNPRKFICLNDDIDHQKPESNMVKSILIDFYESFYPIPSQFELSREFKNRFLTVHELKSWQEERERVKFVTYVCLIMLIFVIMLTLFNAKITSVFRRFIPRRKIQIIVRRFQNV